MQNKYKISLRVMFALCFSVTSPLFATSTFIQMQGPSDKQTVVSEKSQFAQSSTKPVMDEYNGRKVITLDHGSVDNPYLVGATTRGGHRHVSDYAHARKMKWGKTPKKVADFKDWQVGDWMRKVGNVGLMTPEAKTLGMVRGMWSRRILKMEDNLILVAFTRERETGPIIRTQILPLLSIESQFLALGEDTRVYQFDLTRDEDCKALETLLATNILPGKNVVGELAKAGSGTLVTTQKVTHHRKTNTPLSFDVPFLFHFHTSHHVDRPKAVVTDHRNDVATVVTSKVYSHEKAHNHLSAAKMKRGKKWYDSTHSHQQFTRSYAGNVVKTSSSLDQKGVTSRTKNLEVQIAFTHDNAKVKKIDRYTSRMAKQVGIKDFVIDTRYRQDARIGYVELLYTLRVTDGALKQLIENNSNVEKMFNEPAHDLIDDYFYIEQDPNQICDRTRFRFRQRCIRKERERTIASLEKIEKYLLKLYRDDVEGSDKKSAHYLAKIAQELTTNQFVLQTFILALPENPEGYGKLEIFGEQFLGKRFTVDPKIEQGEIVALESDDDSSSSSSSEDDLDNSIGEMDSDDGADSSAWDI